MKDEDFEEEDPDFNPYGPAQYPGTDTWLRAVKTPDDFFLEIAPSMDGPWTRPEKDDPAGWGLGDLMKALMHGAF